jgi:hypothetical protein
MEIGMWKAVLAGAMLATVGATVCQAEDFASASYENYEYVEPVQRTPAVTSGHIARLKAALRLTAAQKKYWPAVETALRKLAHRGSGQGWRQRARAAVGSANAIRRVAAAARPLIRALSEQQRQDGMRVIQALGFSSLASAL